MARCPAAAFVGGSSVADDVEAIIHCAHHADAAAAWHCSACGTDFCSGCVNLYTTPQHRFASCKSCGGPAIPLAPEPGYEPPDDRRFLARMSDAFAYPLRNRAWVVLLVRATCFWLAFILGTLALRGGFEFLYGLPTLAAQLLGLTSLLLGLYLIAYLQEVISATATGSAEPPGDWAPVDLVEWIRPIWLLVCPIVICFAPAWAWEIYSGRGQDAIYFVLLLLGTLYLPMGLLAVTLFNSPAALAPWVVVPAIRRIPRDYVVVVMGLVVLESIILLFLPLHRAAGELGPLLALLLILYFLMLEAHLIGQMYHANRFRLGWFEQQKEAGSPQTSDEAER